MERSFPASVTPRRFVALPLRVAVNQTSSPAGDHWTPSIETNPEASRRAVRGDFPVIRGELIFGIFGGDAALDGKAEVPPNTSAATGTADIDYDAASKKLSWKETYTGLSGPATAAHFTAPPKPARTRALRWRSPTPARARWKAARR